MADLDKAKDYINNIRLYMTMCVALIISVGSGITRMFEVDNFSYIFFIANVLLILLLLIFIFLAKKLHKKTDELKDIE